MSILHTNNEISKKRKFEENSEIEGSGIFNNRQLKMLKTMDREEKYKHLFKHRSMVVWNYEQKNIFDGVHTWNMWGKVYQPNQKSKYVMGFDKKTEKAIEPSRVIFSINENAYNNINELFLKTIFTKIRSFYKQLMVDDLCLMFYVCFEPSKVDAIHGNSSTPNFYTSNSSYAYMTDAMKPISVCLIENIEIFSNFSSHKISDADDVRPQDFSIYIHVEDFTPKRDPSLNLSKYFEGKTFCSTDGQQHTFLEPCILDIQDIIELQNELF